MEKTYNHLPNFATYTKQKLCHNTLDDAQLMAPCPLDNGRHTDHPSTSARHSAGQLDQLPAELLIHILLHIDLLSLTSFRRVNRRAMDLVDSVPQYAAIIKHCPDIIYAILTVQADAYNCDTLYKTLSTTRCSTCKRFGDYLNLFDCRRVCYFCFTRQLKYFPLIIGRASEFLNNTNGVQRRNTSTSRRGLRVTNRPSVLTLPTRYYTAWGSEGGNLAQKGLRDLASSGLPKSDNTTREPQRFMAIITAPYLFDSGRLADWGYFCPGCQGEMEEYTRHLRTKYTREGLLKHMRRYGPVKKMPGIPGSFMHVTQD